MISLLNDSSGCERRNVGYTEISRCSLSSICRCAASSSSTNGSRNNGGWTKAFEVRASLHDDIISIEQPPESSLSDATFNCGRYSLRVGWRVLKLCNHFAIDQFVVSSWNYGRWIVLEFWGFFYWNNFIFYAWNSN